MARVTVFTKNGKTKILKRVAFERDPIWTKILGPIPTKREATEEPEQDERERESEMILQGLIELEPGIIPWDELYDPPDEGKVCVVCKEVRSAATDVLIVERTKSGKGRFVIVEAKLIKNAEIHRKVLGQALEYLGNLVFTEEQDELKNKASRYWKEKRDGNFQEEMKKAFGEEWKSLWQSAWDNLKEGDVRVLIVADRIPEDLRMAVGVLPSNVLLSGVEIQPHDEGTGADKRASSATVAAITAGPDGALRAQKKYFSEIFPNISLSYAATEVTDDGCVVSEAISRGNPGASREKLSFEDLMERLGGDKTVPGGCLRKLEEAVRQTPGGKIAPGQQSVALRFHGLPGLVARVEKGQLKIWFIATNPLGNEQKRDDEVLGILKSKQFPRGGFKGNKTQVHMVINGGWTDEEVDQLVGQLESLYKDLDVLKSAPSPV